MLAKAADKEDDGKDGWRRRTDAEDKRMENTTF